jgi:hypothetical protein
MPVTDTDRVIAPAKESITPCTPWPYGAHTLDNVTFRGPNVDDCAARNGAAGGCAWQQDMSFLGNIPSAHDFFFRIYKPQQPYIAHTREDGYVSLSPSRWHPWLALVTWRNIGRLFCLRYWPATIGPVTATLGCPLAPHWPLLAAHGFICK